MEMKPWVREGVVYAMDYAVVPRLRNISDWLLLSSSWDHFGLYQGTNVRVTMEFKVSKRHISRSTISMDMVQRVGGGRGKRGDLVEKSKGSWQRNYIYIFWGGGREDEDKRRQKNGQT